MKLGDGLFAINTRVSELMQQISGNIKQISTDDGILSELKNITNSAFSELELCRNEIKDSSEQIKAITCRLQNIQKKCKFLEKIVISFKLVALNIAIKSQRSQKYHYIFDVLTNDINQLSEKIISITDTLYDSIKTVQTAQTRANDKIFDGLIEFENLEKNATRTITATVQDIEQIMKISIKTLEQAHFNSNIISCQVNEVVMQIQFHDRMHQRIEHISKALKDAGNQSNQILDLKIKSDCEDKGLNKVYTVISLQSSQLKDLIEGVRSVFEKNKAAFLEIQDKFFGLVESYSVLGSNYSSDHSSKLDKKENQEVDSFSCLKNSFIQISQLIKKTHIIAQHLTDIAGQVGETNLKMSDCMQQLGKISSEAQLIALNSIITSANLGSEGAVFEKLSQILHGLSGQTSEIVLDVNASIAATNALIENINNKNSQKSNSDFHQLTQDASVDFFETGIKKITEIYSAFKQDSSNSFQNAFELKNSISKIISDLEFIHDLAEELNRYWEQITKFNQLLKPLTDHTKDYVIPELSDLSQRYTMQKEREIHEKLFQNNQPVSTQPIEDNIEFFTIDDSHTENTTDYIKNADNDPISIDQNAALDKKDEDFGDNVELF